MMLVREGCDRPMTNERVLGSLLVIIVVVAGGSHVARAKIRAKLPNPFMDVLWKSADIVAAF